MKDMSNQFDDLRSAEHWTTKIVVTQQARDQPKKIAIRFVDGPDWTFADVEKQALSVAAGLQALDVQSGDRVAAMLKNGPEYCSLWWGAHFSGAVLVGINTESLGAFLQHALAISEAKILVVDAMFVDRIIPIAPCLPSLAQLVVVNGESILSSLSIENMSIKPFAALQRDPAEYQAVPLNYSDLACLIFTSGTTGPSKAVMMPHAHCYLFGLGTIEHGDLSSNDIYYVNMPLFHANAMLMQVYACLISGATAIVRERFSASCWLPDIHKYQITHTNLLGVMSEFIAKQPPTEADKTHRLRHIFAAPITKNSVEMFKSRFGVENVLELYGMSEVNIPLYSPRSAPKTGSCGKPYARYFDVRIADPITDEPLIAGKVGEIQVRPKQAYGFMSGYFNMPDQTVQAWRNFWFHTGDAGYCDDQGYYYFVDRIKDSIRRRGENISSYEVESALLEFPDITECAVIAVNSDIPGGEDEVLAIVATLKGNLNVVSLLAHARSAIPKHALPRYIRHLAADKFPRTASHKVQKHVLREQGLTQDTWDTESDGFVGNLDKEQVN